MSGRVEVDIGCGVLVDFLREIGVDPQEFGGIVGLCSFGGLLF